MDPGEAMLLFWAGVYVGFWICAIVVGVAQFGWRAGRK